MYDVNFGLCDSLTLSSTAWVWVWRDKRRGSMHSMRACSTCLLALVHVCDRLWRETIGEIIEMIKKVLRRASK